MESKKFDKYLCSREDPYALHMFSDAGMNMTWEDLLYGFKERLLSVKDINEFAFRQIEAGDERQEVLNLAWPDIDDIEAETYIRRLGANLNDSMPELYRKRWQYAFVLEAIAKAGSCRELLYMTDSICARFGYPSELVPVSLDGIFFNEDHSIIIILSYIADENCAETRSIEQSKYFYKNALKDYINNARSELGLEDAGIPPRIDDLCS